MEVESKSKQVDQKKKKKKKKKKSVISNSEKGKEMDDGIDRREFPWYFLLGPLALLFVTYKYVRPNLVTSAGLILVLALVPVIHSD